METGYLLRDLTIVLVAAGVVSVLFSFLRWPIILGYLVAGMCIGPHMTKHLWVHNETTVQEISTLGVIFLMFYCGLSFDLKRVKQTFVPSFFAVALQTLFSIAVGLTFSSLLGWSLLQGIFLSGVLSITSTMVAIPIISSKDAMKSNYAQFTIGIAILEDILAVLLLALLTGLSQAGHMQWGLALKITFWITVFLAAVFFVGRLVAPKCMKALSVFKQEEVLHVVLIGLILLVGQLAHAFSEALGAFVAGAIFSFFFFTEKFERIVTPMRDIFTAVFFVSIGMLIDPHTLAQNKWTIVFLSLATFLGTTISVWAGLYFTGQKGSVAFKASLPKAQIGEFSFVIAALGQSLGVTNQNFLGITVGVSFLTIIFANVASNHDDTILLKLEKIFPQAIVKWCELYQRFLASLSNNFSKTKLWRLGKKPLVYVSVYFFLTNAVVWITAFICAYLEKQNFSYKIWVQRSLWIFALLIALPFVIAIIRNINTTFMMFCETALKGLFRKMLQHPSLFNIFRLAILSLASIGFCVLFLMASGSFLPPYVSLITFITLGFILSLFFWKDFNKINSQMELMFMDSFQLELETENEKRKRVILKKLSKKHPWNVHIQTISLPKFSKYVGQRILDTGIRKLAGVTILGISRNGFLIYDPSPESHLFPEDQIVVLGSLTQVEKAIACLEERNGENESNFVEHTFDIGQVIITNDSILANQTLADANIRKTFGVNVVGIERGQQKIQNPPSDEILKGGDVLLVVGQSSEIEKFQKSLLKVS